MTIVPASMWPEAIAAAHDRAIIAHNHFVRLRRAEANERMRVLDVDHAKARWERLCRRWASKH